MTPSITIICANFLELDLPKNSVHLVVTSPPYFNAKDYGQPAWESYNSYLEFLNKSVAKLVTLTIEGRMLCFVVSPVIVARKKRSTRSVRYNIPADLHAICNAAGLRFVEEIIWKKPEGAAINRNQRFSLDRHPLQWKANPAHETILIYQKATDKLNDAIIKEYAGKGRILGEYDRSSVWEINPETRSGHPAPFPLALPQKLIRYYTWEGDLVLDPFMGSGTTLLAAKQANRSAIGVDMNSDYCKIAEGRLI